jgi:hypothetical protein
MPKAALVATCLAVRGNVGIRTAVAVIRNMRGATDAVKRPHEIKIVTLTEIVTLFLEMLVTACLYMWMGKMCLH